MNKKEVLQFLKDNQDSRGIEHWKKCETGGLKSYGIGLTKLRL